MNMDDINDEKNEKKSYLKKLDFIWEKIGNSDVSRFQNIVLHHVLGEYQSRIEIRFVSRILDNPNVTPEKLNEYLVDGVQRLVTYAYIGVDRMSNLKKKYKEELDVEKRAYADSLNSMKLEYENSFKRARNELKRKDELINQYKADLAKKDKEGVKVVPKVEIQKEIVYQTDEVEINRLNGEKARLERKIEKLQKECNFWKNEVDELLSKPEIDLSDYVDRGQYEEVVNERDSLQAKPEINLDNYVDRGQYDEVVSERDSLQVDYNKLKESKRVLLENAREVKATLDSCRAELREYKDYEKKLLPLLRKSAYQQQHQGKCISLEPSQIEGIIRNYLNGITSYSIGKQMGISKTSINMVIHCEYRAEQSLNKVLRALHVVNKEGNWGGEKQEKLNRLIDDYERSLAVVLETKSIQNENIASDVQSLGDYFSWVDRRKNSIKGVHLEE